MSKASNENATTEICGFDADTILVRGRDLVDGIMGRMSFTELMIFQALGVEPSESQTRIVDAVLVTIMEHGLVPSAVATRLTHYGAPESFQGAVAAGLLGVGDRYAGTAGEAGAILESIVGEPVDERAAKAAAVVGEYRERRRPVPGFGHPIHQSRDPRVEKLFDIARNEDISGDFIAAAELLESALGEALGKRLVTNISAAIGAVLAEAKIPSAMMRGVVLTARCAGLVGHLLEEMQNPAAHALWVGARSRVEYED